MPANRLPVVQFFPAHHASLTLIRRFVQGRADDAGLPSRVTHDLLVAVTEACTDVLAHETAWVMVVSWWMHDGAVEIRVKDEGVIEHLPADPDADQDGAFGDGGLGFPYILAFVDEYALHPGGPGHPSTVVRLVKETNAA